MLGPFFAESGSYPYTGPEDRMRAIREVQGFGIDHTLPLLITLLHHQRLDVRCTAAEMILEIDPGIPTK